MATVYIIVGSLNTYLLSDARSPAYATLGRANFLGAYLAMLLPLALALAAGVRGHATRPAMSGLLLGLLAAIALTLARGAWLAALVSLGAYGLLSLWPGLDRRRRLALGAFASLAILVGGAVGFVWLSGAQAGSEAARATIWRATLGLIAERPWLGYGPETLEIVFPRVYPPQLVYYQGRDLVVDRAHNLVLDWAVIGGMPAVAAWLALLGSAFRVGGRALGRLGCEGRAPERRYLVACLAALAGSLAGNLVGFEVVPTATAGWLLLGVVAALVRQDPATDRAPDGDEPFTSRRVGAERWRAVPAALIGGLTMLLIWQLNGRPLLADADRLTAQRAAARGDWAAAVRAAERAVQRWPASPEHRLLQSQALWGLTDRGLDGDGEALAGAEAAVRAALDLRPASYQVWAAVAEFYRAAGTYVDPGVLPLARAAYQEAVSRAPRHATLYVSWGLMDLATGDPASAAAAFARALDLDATYGDAYRLLGDAEMELGRLDAAAGAYQEAIRWLPDPGPAYRGLSAAHAALGLPEEAARAWPGGSR